MSDETTPEAAVTSGPAARSTAAPRSESPQESRAASPAASTGSGSDTAPRGHFGWRVERRRVRSGRVQFRRHRSDRRAEATSSPRLAGWSQPPQAGHRHRQPGGTNGAGSPGASDRDDDADDDEFDDDELGHDYTDAAADRGMTTDDVADVAMEEAEIEHTPRAPETRGPLVPKPLVPKRLVPKRRRRSPGSVTPAPRPQPRRRSRRATAARRRRRPTAPPRPSGGVDAVDAVAVVAPVAPAAARAAAPVAAPHRWRWQGGAAVHNSSRSPATGATSCAPTSASARRPGPRSTTTSSNGAAVVPARGARPVAT